MATSATNSHAHASGAAGLQLYWRVSGVAFAAITGIGFLLVAAGRADMLGSFLVFDTGHNVLHAALAAGSIALGFGAFRPGVLRLAARVMGVGYVLLGLVGLVSGGLFGVGDLVDFHLELGENLLHLALGAWGAFVGFRP
jgi:hypothetical protein